MTIDWKELAAPFSNIDLEWRLQRSGEKNGKIWAICIPYVTNRAIMERLDAVLTPAGWKNEFTTGPHGGVLCGISILITTNKVAEWVTKWDGAENTNIEAVKGGLSGAMKRAAVQWGMGRHLYEIPESFADISESGIYRGEVKDKKTKKVTHSFRWNPPKLPGNNPPPKTTETKKAEKTVNFKFLKVMREEKDRIDDDEVYYSILGGLGYEKANQIIEPNDQKKAYAALKDVRIATLKESDNV